jgi:hypothetical protein
MTPRVRQYAAELAAEHMISAEALMSRSRVEPVAAARLQLYRRLSDDGFNSLQIARWLGREGSTVRHALRKGRV